MFRLIASIVVVAMLSASGAATLQHVHAYADHEHADHHHGPASHTHATVAHKHHPDSHAGDEAPRFEGCDPGEHVVSLVFTRVAPRPDHAPVPVTLDTIVVARPEQIWCPVTPSDTRAHSPPRPTDAPLRGPPMVYLA